jgi:tetratricopeptide (TPR) repeat protein
MGPDSPASDEIRRFEDQYRRQPESLVFARLADAYRKAGRPDKALSLLEDGLIRHPDYPSGHIVKARALRDMGRLDETLESFRRVLELDAANLVAIRELAALADERGDVEEAQHWYERLGQIDPTNLEVRQRLRELEAATAESVQPEPVEAESVESDGEVEGPHAWWDDSAVDLPTDEIAAEPTPDALPEPVDLDAADMEKRPEDEVIEAILNGNVPETVRAEDTWWYEEASNQEEPEPSRDADLLTRTMADLYAEQGLHREAAEIYEELLKDSPGDPELLSRLESVRQEAWEPPEATAVVEEVHEHEADAKPEEEESLDFTGAPEVDEDPAPMGRPKGTPWTDELRRLLRIGEESAGALPDPATADSSEVEAPADRASENPVEEPDDSDGSSSFARDWIRGLETDG